MLFRPHPNQDGRMRSFRDLFLYRKSEQPERSDRNIFLNVPENNEKLEEAGQVLNSVKAFLKSSRISWSPGWPIPHPSPVWHGAGPHLSPWSRFWRKQSIPYIHTGSVCMSDTIWPVADQGTKLGYSLQVHSPRTWPAGRSGSQSSPRKCCDKANK